MSLTDWIIMPCMAIVLSATCSTTAAGGRGSGFPAAAAG